MADDLVSGELIFVSIFDPTKEQTTANFAVAANWLDPCGLNQVSVSQGINVAEMQVFVNCNPYLGNESETLAKSSGKRPMTISASGPMEWDLYEALQAIHDAELAHPMRIMMNKKGFHEGKFLLETLENTANRSEPTAQTSISLRSAANPKWVESVWNPPTPPGG